nr:HD domain-containing phosphohydrolase [Anaerocolumna sedimenticola]
MLLQETLDLFIPENETAMGDDLEEAIDHGILVSKLAFLLSKEMKMDANFCYSMAIAGMVHDIGKLKLGQFLYKRSDNALTVEEMKYIRMHPAIGYEILKNINMTTLYYNPFTIIMKIMTGPVIRIISRKIPYQLAEEF